MRPVSYTHLDVYKRQEYRAVQIVRYYHVVYQNRVNADAYHNEEALKTCLLYTSFFLRVLFRLFRLIRYLVGFPGYGMP